MGALIRLVSLYLSVRCWLKCIRLWYVEQRCNRALARLAEVDKEEARALGWSPEAMEDTVMLGWNAEPGMLILWDGNKSVWDRYYGLEHDP